MKRLLPILFLLAAWCNSPGQSCNYIDFKRVGNGCYGCASFYWGIDYIGKYGDYHYFQPCFYSNSHYTNGKWAFTYVYGIQLTVDDVVANTPTWITFQGKDCHESLLFYTINRYPKIYIYWQGYLIP